MTADTAKWYRHRQTGDRGKLFYEGVAPFVQYDRPNGAKVPFRDTDWVEEIDRPPLSRGQIARVAFAADRQLLYFTAHYGKAKRDWAALTDGERADWMEHGPATGLERKKLFADIMAALDPLTRTA